MFLAMRRVHLRPEGSVDVASGLSRPSLKGILEGYCVFDTSPCRDWADNLGQANRRG